MYSIPVTHGRGREGAGAELGFCCCFSDALDPEFSSICGAARFIQCQQQKLLFAQERKTLDDSGRSSKMTYHAKQEP